MKSSTDQSPPVLAQWLGYAGLIPFAALAGMVWWLQADDRMAAGFALTAYGATIASFLGAIHWGLAMRGHTDHAPALHFVWGVAPSLLAWVALLLAPAKGLVLLAILLGLCFAVDRATYVQFGLQRWLRMRLQLTVVAATSCLLAAAGLAS